MADRLITGDSLGAWLVKCQPRLNREVPRAILSGGTEPVTRWCVSDNYRSRMMAPGDRVVLWVSGDGRQLARGVWGLGWVTGPVRAMVGGEPGPGPGPVKQEVPLHVPLLRAGVSAAEIRAAGILDLEVLRQPQGANPSWVSKDQLAALAALWGTWPARP